LFGYQGPHSSDQKRMPGTVVVARYAGQADGMVGHLTVLLDAGTTMELMLGLYADQGGAPGALLTSTTVSNVQIGSVTGAVPPVAVTQGTAYWIAVLSPVSTAFWSFSVVTANLACGDIQNSQSTTLTALPDPWGAAGPDYPSMTLLAYASP
jgi:hypothetical protein